MNKKPKADMKKSCLPQDNVVYSCKISTKSNERTYVGATQNYIKSRGRGSMHRYLFKNIVKSCATGLSKYACGLQYSNTEFSLKWEILEFSLSYKFDE